MKGYDRSTAETETCLAIEEEMYRKYFQRLLKHGMYTYVDGKLHGRFNVSSNTAANSKKGFNWKGKAYGQDVLVMKYS